MRVEMLEPRTLLNAVFDPIFGVETQKQDGSDGKMFRPPLNIVFWGPEWQGSNPTNNPDQWNSSLSPEADKILGGLEQLINSTYLNVTEQYGADPYNMFINDVRWDNSQPGDTFDSGKIDDVVQNQIDNNHFPESDGQKDQFGNDRTPIYIVITRPGALTSDDKGAVGFNTAGWDFDLPADFDWIPEIWSSTSNKPDGSIDVDSFTSTVGHELGEILTDFNTDGFEVNTPAAWATAKGGGDDQIGDKEGNAYWYRMSDSSGNPGVQVQPLWSRDEQKWVVTDGNAQNINLTPRWDLTDPTKLNWLGNYDLTVNGDQWLDINDKVQIDTGAAGNIKLTLNNEVYNFDNKYLNSITLNLRSGVNDVYLTGKLPAGVSLSMNAAGSFGGSIHLHGPDGVQNFWNITGPNTGTLLPYTGSGTPAYYNFTDVSSITGGTGSDSFSFDPGGSLSGSIDGGGGADFLNFGSFVDATHPNGVTVNLADHTATPLGGTFTNVANVFGSTGTDTLIAPGPLWKFDFNDSVIVDNTAISSFENFVGLGGDDTFKFVKNVTVAHIDGGGGTNTLDYSSLQGPVTVNFNTGTASNITGTFTNIQNVVGSQSTLDTIVGPDALWTIDGPNSGNVNGLTFSSFENLQGSNDTDTFKFADGGSISGNLDGGGGTNALDFSAVTTPVTLNLQSDTATGIGGTFSNINSFMPGSGGFNIVGPDQPTTWTVTGVNTVNALGFTFTNTPSLTGGSSNDTFLFQTGGKLTGKIDGGGGTNTLSYAGSAGDVKVDLAINYADRTGGVSHIQNVMGGNGNNLLVGDDNPNVLTGGLGRNILIGRGGADLLKGGGGDNILIGDSTVYDLDPNLLALKAIFAEWNRTDVSYQKRVSDLLSAGGAGLNGAFTLGKSSILSDISQDVLVGSAALDWFFLTNKQDSVSGGTTPGDHTTVL